jgi:hypothetical protein
VLSTGRVHPALIESRQQQLVLARLVGQLDLREDEPAGGASVSDAARDVASARWRGRRAQTNAAR